MTPLTPLQNTAWACYNTDPYIYQGPLLLTWIDFNPIMDK